MKKTSIKEGKKNRKKKGFTLVELIIVIAIIAILAAMAIPKLSAVKLDAKVSNDVAAAKNIQTVSAMLLANGTFKAGQADVTVSDNNDIKSRLSGTYAEKGVSEAVKGGPFTVHIDDKENITVLASAKQLCPEKEDDKKAYVALAQGTTTK